MIGSLHGEVSQIGLDGLTLVVSGLGFRIHATPATLADIRLGQQITLSTSLVVREDSLTLFGFASQDERDTYEILQTVSGVGPKLALAMLAVHSPEELRLAVENEDLAALKRVPGVGPKSARRLVLELQGKLGSPTRPAHSSPAPTSVQSEVLEALVSLGWNTKAAEQAIASAAAQADPKADAAQLLRASLVELGGKHRG